MKKAVFFMVLAFASPLFAQGIFAPGDAVIGGQSDGTNFVAGVSGTAGGVNNWPGAEGPEHLIDGVGQKYLNFAEFNTGVLVTPASGSSVAKSIQFWAANDAVERDPTGFELWGTNDAVSGTEIALSLFSPIATGDLLLPETRNAGGDAELLAENSYSVAFDNSTAYSSYLVLFPGVKNEAAANSMQIAEVQLYNVVPEPGMGVIGLGLLGLLPLVRRRR